MTVEQIAIRQEIRQMLNEAGINRNTLKSMAKEVLEEELQKAVKQALNETDINTKINCCYDNAIGSALKSVIREQVRNRICGVFDTMRITVDITDSNNTSIFTSNKDTNTQ